MQFPTNDHPGIERLDGSYSNTASDQVSCVILPHSYTDVHDSHLDNLSESSEMNNINYPEKKLIQLSKILNWIN